MTVRRGHHSLSSPKLRHAMAVTALVLAGQILTTMPALAAEIRHAPQEPLHRLITHPGWFCTQYTFAVQSIGGGVDDGRHDRNRRWLCTQWTFAGPAFSALKPPLVVIEEFRR